MKFLDGFLLVNFIPFAILAILGLILFFIKARRTEKYYYPLLFIIIVLCVVSLIRLPFADIARRYTMPLLVPGIIISTLTLMLLPSLLKQFKIPYGKAIIRTALAIVLIICVAKAMRVQESKNYLYDIPEAIKLDCKKNNINKKVALLVFGNPGGHLELDSNVEVINLENKHSNDSRTNLIYQLSSLNEQYNQDTLIVRFPLLYMLIVDNSSYSLIKEFENKYNEKFQLLYEYVRNKDKMPFRLFRLKSVYPSAWSSPDEFENILIHNNILKNSDFKVSYRVPPENNIAKVLCKRGIVPGKDGGIYLPEEWMINTEHGSAYGKPVFIDFPAKMAHELNINSEGWISLFTKDTFDGNKAYLLSIQANAGQQGGKLTLWAYIYTNEMKYVKAVNYREINLSNGYQRQLLPLRLKNCKKFKLALLCSGNVGIRNIMFIPAINTGINN